MDNEHAHHVPAVVRRLRERRDKHLSRGWVYRGAYVVAGFVILGAGLAMVVLPGPAFVVIPIGLAVLSLEFVWAERLLERALIRADGARRRAADATPRQKLVSVVSTALAAAAFVAAAILWDITYVPV
jgi:uncharacterized protein (TIGR02611 family)